MCGSNRLILDAGTGIRALGASLADQTGLNAHIFLTHTHIDHINGFPFFRPAYDPENCFQIWAGHLHDVNGGLQGVLAGIMRAPIFPVPLHIMHACIGFHDFVAGETFEPFEGVTLRTAPLNHPNGATGYRIDFAGKAICYVTDTEHRDGALDNAILELIRDSQIVIYDATYTEAEYRTFGVRAIHLERGAKLCEAAAAERLVAFHHDPDHDDADLDRIAEQLDRGRPGSVMAREGLVLRP